MVYFHNTTKDDSLFYKGFLATQLQIVAVGSYGSALLVIRAGYAFKIDYFEVCDADRSRAKQICFDRCYLK